MADYKIPTTLAVNLANFIRENTGYHAILCNQDGVIISDSDASRRVGNVHEGSKKMLQGQLAEFVVTPEMAAANSQLKEGQNYPIEVDGQRVGTFAIAGPLDYVRPIARVVVALLSTRLKQAQQMEMARDVAGSVSRQVAVAVEAIEHIFSSAQQLTAKTDEVVDLSQDSVSKVKETGKILDLSRGIATQTKLLSLNASIEAARAGTYGRGFSVVATEMQKLAQNSADATEHIDEILQDIQQSMQKVIDGIHQSAEISGEQATAVREITTIVESVRTATQQLLDGFQK